MFPVGYRYFRIDKSKKKMHTVGLFLFEFEVNYCKIAILRYSTVNLRENENFTVKLTVSRKFPMLAITKPAPLRLLAI